MNRAIEKAKLAQVEDKIQFEKIDCRTYGFTTTFDLALMLDFSISRIHALDELAYLLYNTFEALTPGGLFIFEHFTPYNSIEFATKFDDGGPGPFENSWFRRTDHYEAHHQTQISKFEMQHGPISNVEMMYWRAWHVDQIQGLIDCTDFEKVEAIDLSTGDPASQRSLTVMWILRKPRPV